MEARAPRIEPLALPAAVIWQCIPAPGEGRSCGEAMEMLASQVHTPETDSLELEMEIRLHSSLRFQKGR